MHDQTTVTITNGTSVSAAIDGFGKVLVGIQLPAVWSTAGLAFEAGAALSDGSAPTTWVPVTDSTGTALAYTPATAAAAFRMFSPDTLAGLPRWFRLRSGTSAVPVNQGADRSIVLIFRNEPH